MTDQRIRSLERRWKQTGASEDEVALILERVRTGILDQSGLELAAYLGSAVSLDALGRDQRPPPTRAERRRGFDFGQWLSGLRQFSKETSVRVAIAVTRSFASQGESPPDVAHAVSEALRVSESWVCDGGDASKVRVVTVPPRYQEGEGFSRAPLHPPSVMNTLASLGSLVGAILADDAGTGISVVTRRRASAALLRLRLLDRHLECSRGGLGPPTAIQSELIPWALGHRDPVRQRVEVRQSEAAGE